MRIVVSGTHASGKSTLVSDFAVAHPDFTVLTDPFDDIDEAWDAPSASMFAAQLRVSADRLHSEGHGDRLIAERGPIDFLAYILALAELTDGELDPRFIDQATERTAAALNTIDVLVVLPLTPSDPIHVGEDEHLELRDAMNQILLELLDDPAIIGPGLEVAEITGSPAERLAALEALAGVARRGR